MRIFIFMILMKYFLSCGSNYALRSVTILKITNSDASSSNLSCIIPGAAHRSYVAGSDRL